MNSPKPTLRDRVELAIITYNRAGPLARTLEQLQRSPFAQCRITVLDNCSSDDTPGVCERFAAELDDFHVVRNPYNIGLSANYLRAVEVTQATYSWILSDDEYYDFSDCDDFLAALLEAEVDLFSIGSPHLQDWELGTRTTVPELIAKGGQFHNSFTFIAGSLFRTELFDSSHFFRGYRYGNTLYPHMPFVQDQVLRGSLIFTSRKRIVERNRGAIHETVGDFLGWLVGWARACETIEDPHLRQSAIYQAIGEPREWRRQVAIHTMLTKLDAPDRLPHYLSDLLVICRGAQRAAVAASVPMAVLPRPLYALVRRVVRRRRGMSMEDPSFDEFRL